MRNKKGKAITLTGEYSGSVLEFDSAEAAKATRTTSGRVKQLVVGELAYKRSPEKKWG